jgi:hypothetical protein
LREPIFKDPRFDALRNAIYHTQRASFLQLVNRSLNFMVIVLGTAVVAKIATRSPSFSYSLEIGVVVVATAQLVFDFGGRACVHAFLQKRYYELLAEMETGAIDTAKAKEKWSAKLLTIAADEPVTLRALDAIAYNQALDAWTSDPEVLRQCRVPVTYWQRRLRNIRTYHDVQFQPAVEPQNGQGEKGEGKDESKEV